MDKKEAFEVLGLSPGCSSEQAKKKYRELAKKYHPDRVQDKNHAAAENQMKQVNAAFRLVLPDLATGKNQNRLEPESSANNITPVKNSFDQLKKQFFNKMNTLFNAGQRKSRPSGKADTGGQNRPVGDFDEILRKYASQFSEDRPAGFSMKKTGRFRKTETHQYRNYIQLQKRYVTAAKKRSRAKGVEPVGPIRPVSAVDPVEKT